MKLIIYITALAFVLGSCVNNDRKAEGKGTDSLANVSRLLRGDSLLIHQPNTAKWLANNLQVPTVLWGNLQLENYWVEDNLEMQPFEGSPTFYSDYAPVLRWSADSNYLLDVGSYGLIAVKGNKGEISLEGGEPDTEIAVIFIRENRRARLLFVGPSSTIIDATWIDHTEALIVGTFKQEQGLEDTLVWLVDVKEKLFRLYNFQQARFGSR